MYAKKKKKSTFQIITHIVVWLMLIATIIGLGVPAIMAVYNYLNHR